MNAKTTDSINVKNTDRDAPTTSASTRTQASGASPKRASTSRARRRLARENLQPIPLSDETIDAMFALLETAHLRGNRRPVVELSGEEGNETIILHDASLADVGDGSARDFIEHMMSSELTAIAKSRSETLSMPLLPNKP